MAHSNAILAEGGTGLVQGTVLAQGTDLVQGLVVFLIAGLAMVLGALVFGRLLRPSLPTGAKQEAYECGEVTIGPSWVQFDLRFYVVALVFLVFDVEVALFYLWAVVFGDLKRQVTEGLLSQDVLMVAMWDMLFFFGVVVVGFLYLWRFGYLDWVRATTANRATEARPVICAPIPPPEPKRTSTGTV